MRMAWHGMAKAMEKYKGSVGSGRRFCFWTLHYAPLSLRLSLLPHHTDIITTSLYWSCYLMKQVLFFIFESTLAIFSPSYFHINFRIGFLSSIKSWGLIGTTFIP